MISTLLVTYEIHQGMNPDSPTILVLMNQSLSELLNPKLQGSMDSILTNFKVFNPFSTETVLLVGYWSPITYTLLYT